MKTPLDIVILSSRLPEDIWLINKISGSCHVQGIVLPNNIRFGEFSLFRVLQKTIKRSGIRETINQSAMYLYRRLFEHYGDNRAMRQLFADHSFCHIEDKTVEILRVDDINDEKVVAFILQKQPDVIVASGTSILKAPILEAGKGRIINLHPGLAPQYRGRYGSYWPIYNHEPECVGVTIHTVDAGIDTGGILAQGLVEYNWNDYVKTITYKQHVLGGELMLKCVTDFDALHSHAYHKPNCPSKNYRAMGLRQYLQAKHWIHKNRRGQTINAGNIFVLSA